MNKLSAYNLVRSFAYAFHGVAHSLRHERNLRIHFFMAAYVLYFSRYFGLTPAEYAALFAVIGLVVACEMINTAIEAAVDLSTPAYSALAKIAKDAAAGAVLVSTAASVATGIVLFWQPEILRLIWADILTAPLVWLFLAAITVFLIAWPEHRKIADGAENQKWTSGSPPKRELPETFDIKENK